MKHFRKILWMILAIHIVLILVVVFGFKVDDMTLSKGEVKDFNEGWKMTWQKDGKSINEEFFFLILFFYFTILYWFRHTLT